MKTSTSRRLKMFQERKSADFAKKTADQPASSNASKSNRRSLFSVLFNSKSPPPPPPLPVEDTQSEQSNKHEGLPASKEEEACEREPAELEGPADLELLGETNKPEAETEPNDADSYVLDLNDCVANEKFKSLYDCTINHKQRISKSASASSAKSWHENQLHVSLSEVRNRPPRASSRERAELQSPLIRQFFEKHKLHLSSIDSTSSDTSGCEGESPDSLSSFNPINPPRGKPQSFQSAQTNLQTSLKPNFTVIRKSNHEITIIRREEETERDLRLINWRLQASRLTNNNNNNPSSSDSELEDELNSRSPALALTCSDDTSCSSVELIWAPRRREAPAEQVARLNAFEQKHQHTGNVQPSSLSILELAKPSRAKGKRFGRRKSGLPSKGETREKSSPDKQWVENPIFTTTEDEEELPVPSPPLELPTKRLALQKLSEPVLPPLPVLSGKLEETQSLSSLSLSRSITLSFSSEFEEDDDDDYELPIDCTRREEDLIASNRKPAPIKNRWSIMRRRRGRGRRKSSSHSQTDGSVAGSAPTKRDNIYLNHIMEQLDKKFKTNVSSIKSQLSVKFSDTSKRASILADQLITTIKDTTKEQLLFANNQHNKNKTNKNNTMPKKGSLNSPTNSEKVLEGNDKSKLFSLIYLHQQQPNGQTVITKQPTATNRKQQINLVPHHQEEILSAKKADDEQTIKVVPTAQEEEETTLQKSSDDLNPQQEVETPAAEAAAKPDKQADTSASSSIVENYITATSDGNNSIESRESEKHDKESLSSKSDCNEGKEKKEDKSVGDDDFNNSKATSKSNNENNSTSQNRPKKKSKRKRFRRQINVAKVSDDEEDQFYHTEYVK